MKHHIYPPNFIFFNTISKSVYNTKYSNNDNVNQYPALYLSGQIMFHEMSNKKINQKKTNRSYYLHLKLLTQELIQSRSTPNAVNFIEYKSTNKKE